MGTMLDASKDFIKGGGAKNIQNVNPYALVSEFNELRDQSDGRTAYDDFMKPDSKWGKYITEGNGPFAPSISYDGVTIHPEQTLPRESKESLQGQIDRALAIEQYAADNAAGKESNFDVSTLSPSEQNYIHAMDPNYMFPDDDTGETRKSYIEQHEGIKSKAEEGIKEYENYEAKIAVFSDEAVMDQLQDNSKAGFIASIQGYQAMLDENPNGLDGKMVAEKFQNVAKTAYSYVALDPDLSSKFAEYQKDPSKFDANKQFEGMSETDKQLASAAFESLNAAWDTPELTSVRESFEKNPTYATLQGNELGVFDPNGANGGKGSADFKAPDSVFKTIRENQSAMTSPSVETTPKTPAVSKPELKQHGAGYDGMPSNLAGVYAGASAYGQPSTQTTPKGIPSNVPPSAYGGASTYGQPSTQTTPKGIPSNVPVSAYSKTPLQPSAQTTPKGIPSNVPPSAYGGTTPTHSTAPTKGGPGFNGQPTNTPAQPSGVAEAPKSGSLPGTGGRPSDAKKPSPYEHIDAMKARGEISNDEYNKQRTEINMKAAMDINAGKIGSGKDRAQTLNDMGYDVKVDPGCGYMGVQDIINAVYSGEKAFDINSLADDYAKGNYDKDIDVADDIMPDKEDDLSAGQ